MLPRVKIFISAICLILSLFLVLAPAGVHAQAGLVPCGTENYTATEAAQFNQANDAQIKNGTVQRIYEQSVKNPCDFSHFFGDHGLISNVTNYIIVLGAAFSAIAFGWAGFLMMTAAGEMSKIDHAKQIFGKVLVGFLIMLSAWLIVHAINAGLISSGFFGAGEVQPI
jgi:hypothetical protein